MKKLKYHKSRAPTLDMLLNDAVWRVAGIGFMGNPAPVVNRMDFMHVTTNKVVQRRIPKHYILLAGQKIARMIGAMPPIRCALWLMKENRDD